MAEGQENWYKGAGGLWNSTNKAGANAWLANGGVLSDSKRPTQVVINIDGKEAMNKKIDDERYETYVNLIGF